MAQQERLFFLEDRDELWLTVKQRIAEISHSTPPLLWVTSPASPEWARHGRLQDLIFISSLLKSRLSWSVTSWLKLSRQTVKQKGSWVDRKVHWDTKPEAMWTFYFPDRMCQWQLSNPSLDHVWCPNTAVLSRSGQYKPCEWWLAKKIQNSVSKGVPAAKHGTSQNEARLSS